MTQFVAITKTKEMGFDAIEFVGMENALEALKRGIESLHQYIGAEKEEAILL